MVRAMIRQIAPQFFTIDMAATLMYYSGKLGFECLGTWQDPPVCSQNEHAAKSALIATPDPELEPRGTRVVSYGLQGWPPHAP